MKFSIIIPLYNKRPYVERTLRSVFAQTFTDYEVLVVDDGSTDGSAELVQQYTDARLHIYRKENGGVCSARNYGIRKAQGDYIAFLDADDEWHPEFLSALDNLSRRFPQAGICATAYNLLPPPQFAMRRIPLY